jgi:hypothetical protein
MLQLSVATNLTAPGMSFAAALRGRREEQQQPQTHQVAVAGPATMEPRVLPSLPQHEQQTTGQSFRAPNVNSVSRQNVERSSSGSTED